MGQTHRLDCDDLGASDAEEKLYFEVRGAGCQLCCQRKEFASSVSIFISPAFYYCTWLGCYICELKLFRSLMNQSLQKGLLRFSALQPDTLPMLVCQEEFLASVAAKSIGESSEIPFKFHSLGARCGLLRSQSHCFMFFRSLLICEAIGRESIR
jgi:hypothetical protein